MLEYASYYSRENNDEVLLLKLLYQSIRAIIKPNIDNNLVRAVYEIKIIAVNGEYPGVPKEKSFDPSTLIALDFIINTPVEKLYTFAVNDTVLKELLYLGNLYRERFTDREFKSMEMLANSMLKI